MNFTIRLLSLFSVLAIILGVVIKLNHWPIDSYIILDFGMLGLAVVYISNFILKEKEIKKNKAKEENESKEI